MIYPYGTPGDHAPPRGPLVPPLLRTTTHAFDSAQEVTDYGTGVRAGDFYQRLSHANARHFEGAVAALERAEGAVAFASGMAAMSAAILGHCGAGDRVIVVEEIYGGTSALARHDMPRFGIEVQRVPILEAGALERALSHPARMVVLESPINPTLRLVDLDRVATLCRRAGALSVVDGTFAPPPLQRPLGCGIDLVVHSATKFLGGHSDVLAGVVAGSHAVLQPVSAWRARTGAMLAPDPAWLLCRSLPTLDLRLREQGRVAAILAQRLAAAAVELGVAAVSHPSLPDHPDHALAAAQLHGDLALVSFVVQGGLAAATRVFDRFDRIARAPSLGGVESTCSLPSSTTHAHLSDAERARAGIAPGLVRVSVGLEGVEPLWDDLRQALGHGSVARTC